jgi:hypothetical protein
MLGWTDYLLVAEAQVVIEKRRVEYNTGRPNSALG